jgi:hypothetical protein
MNMKKPMKTIKFLGLSLLTLGLMSSNSAVPEEQEAVKQLILAFAEAGDRQDAVSLDQYLDENYRIVMNRLFGSSKVEVMPKAVYLDKIRKKEFGGDQRQVSVEEVLINGTSATARVRFSGQKMSFDSIMVLVKDAAGNWKLVSEIPDMK